MKCKFCNNNDAIENSHIIPSFFYDWIKTTSCTGLMRSSVDPNQRVQDGPKKAMLCKDCEQEFSVFENEFKRKYFNRIANYRRAFPEDLELSEGAKKCIYSIAWRLLAEQYYFSGEHTFTEEEFNQFPHFLDRIKSCIKEYSAGFNVHLVPFPKALIERLSLPSVTYQYYDRCICGEVRIWDDWQRFNAFIKIPFAMIVFEYVESEDAWGETNIESCIRHNEISKVPEIVSSFIERHIEQFNQSAMQLSDKQKALLAESVKNGNQNSGSHKTQNKNIS